MCCATVKLRPPKSCLFFQPRTAKAKEKKVIKDQNLETVLNARYSAAQRQPALGASGPSDSSVVATEAFRTSFHAPSRAERVVESTALLHRPSAYCTGQLRRSRATLQAGGGHTREGGGCGTSCRGGDPKQPGAFVRDAGDNCICRQQ